VRYIRQVILFVFFLTIVFFRLELITDQIDEPMHHLPLPCHFYLKDWFLISSALILVCKSAVLCLSNVEYLEKFDMVQFWRKLSIV
jgi:hypothetical protein